MKETKQSYLKGAIIISAGGFLSKVLGAVYRIPLTNLLGGGGMGVYQMVYPLYCILLTVSASGIPTGIARLISSGKGGVERSAFRFYGLIGIIGALLMFALSEPLAAIQGEEAVSLCCMMLSPSVFFVSILSVIRGYFQGRGNMYPTAVTEVGEQVVKVAAGCSLAYILRATPILAVASTLFAVTLSEVVATLGALIFYKRHRPRQPLYRLPSAPISAILKYTLPLTLTAIALPLSQLFESIVAVRLLRVVSADATALYGVYSGCALTLVNLPASLTYGLAASGVPQISPLAESGNFAAAKAKALKALGITLAVSLPMALGLFIFAPLAANIIFGALSAGEREILIRLVRIMSACAVTQSIVQTSSACLTALGKPVLSTVTQWISSAARVSLCAVLIAFTPLGIDGAAYAANAAFLLASVLNFCYIIRAGGKYEDNADWLGNFKRRFNAARKGGAG